MRELEGVVVELMLTIGGTIGGRVVDINRSKAVDKWGEDIELVAVEK